MPPASRSHRSYQADVLLVPLEPRSRTAVTSPAPHDALDGITVSGTDTPLGGTDSAPTSWSC